MARSRPTAAQLAVWRAFLESHTRVTRELDRELRDTHDLPLDWYDVLVQLEEAGGQQSMGELADRLLISPSNCTRLVDRMVKAGLIDRSPNPDDRRVVRASMTRSGRARLRRCAPTHLQGIQRHFAQFIQPGDVERLTHLFTTMAVPRPESDR